MMEDVNFLLAVLGWCTLINFALLMISTVMLAFFGEFVQKIHQKLFQLEECDLRKAYFRYLANYKLLVLFFNLVPYLAIRIAMN